MYELTHVARQSKNCPRVFQLVSQSFVKMKAQLRFLVNKIWQNCIYCFTETWLTNVFCQSFQIQQRKQFLWLFYDKNIKNESREGWRKSYLLVRKRLLPTKRGYLYLYSATFGSMWFIFRLNKKENNSHNNPQSYQTELLLFLEIFLYNYKHCWCDQITLKINSYNRLQHELHETNRFKVNIIWNGSVWHRSPESDALILLSWKIGQPELDKPYSIKKISFQTPNNLW